MPVLTPQQEKFAAILSKKTGLDRNVIRGWTLAEESGSAAQQRAAQSNNNWLNVGYFDSGAGSLTKDSVWSTPESAAEATAQFLKGEKYGASSGIRSILDHAGSHPSDQIEAIAKSGWASSGYRNGSSLVGTYHLVSGLPAPKISVPSASSAVASKTPQAITETAQATTQTTTTAAAPASFLKNSSIPLPDLLTGGDAMPSVFLKGAAFALPSTDKVTTTKTDPFKTPAVNKAPASKVGSTLLATAKSQLGTRYLWGGSAPGGFDCSGLVWWAAKQHGINLPRTSQQQSKVGTPIKDTANLQPGDLLFFGDAKAPHHEAIFAGRDEKGNPLMLESPHTGANVRVVPMRTPTVMRRLPAGNK